MTLKLTFIRLIGINVILVVDVSRRCSCEVVCCSGYLVWFSGDRTKTPSLEVRALYRCNHQGRVRLRARLAIAQGPRLSRGPKREKREKSV